MLHQLEEELLHVRGLHRVYRIKQGLTLEQWERVILRPIVEEKVTYHVMEFLFVHSRVRLVEPMDPLWLERSTVSAEAKQIGFDGKYAT